MADVDLNGITLADEQDEENLIDLDSGDNVSSREDGDEEEQVLAAGAFKLQTYIGSLYFINQIS